MLTLSTYRCSSVTGKGWNGCDSRRTAAAASEKTKTTASIPSLRVRFLRRGDRGGHGGAPGAFGLP